MSKNNPWWLVRPCGFSVWPGFAIIYFAGYKTMKLHSCPPHRIPGRNRRPRIGGLTIPTDIFTFYSCQLRQKIALPCVAKVCCPIEAEESPVRQHQAIWWLGVAVEWGRGGQAEGKGGNCVSLTISLLALLTPTNWIVAPSNKLARQETPNLQPFWLCGWSESQNVKSEQKHKQVSLLHTKAKRAPWYDNCIYLCNCWYPLVKSNRVEPRDW